MKNKEYAAMYSLYLQGASLEEVGAKFGRPRQTVWQGFKVRGLKMRSPKALPFKMVGGLKYTVANGYYTSTVGRKLLHRWIWDLHNGPIPKGFDIHHIDGDTLNNDITNLRLMSHGDHRAIHQKKEWPDKKCKVCGKLFPIGAKQKRKKSCSPMCARALSLTGYRCAINKRRPEAHHVNR